MRINTLTTHQIYHATSAHTQHDARIVRQRQWKHKSSSDESYLQLKHNTSQVSITYLCFLCTHYIDCTDNVNYIKYTKDTTPTGSVLATQLNTTSHGQCLKWFQKSAGSLRRRRRIEAPKARRGFGAEVERGDLLQWNVGTEYCRVLT